MGTDEQRCEVLDWYHLMENLGKVGGSPQRLNRVEARLWHGDVDGAIDQFRDWQHERGKHLIIYLTKNQHRIVN